MPQSTPITVAVVAFDGISPFHLSVPCLVFGENRTAIGVPAFRLLVCATHKGRLRTSAGFDIDVTHDLAALRRAAIVIVPSWRDMGDALERADAIDAKAQRRIVEERFSPARMVTDYVAAYEQTIERWAAPSATA